MHLIGVDIGGTHASAAQVGFDGWQAKLSGFEEVDVDALGGSDEILDAWAGLIAKVADSSPDLRIGIAMPGPFDYEKGISLIKDQGKLRSLLGFSVKDELAAKLDILPGQIRFTNDAEAFLSGESYAGAGRQFQNSIGITLGTGLGSAIKVMDVVKDAKLWTAPFRDGIAEDYLGTAWFIRYLKQQYQLDIAGVKDLTTPEIGPSIQEEVFGEFGRALGEFLFGYLTRLQSEGVVLGGKISLSAGLFLPHTSRYLEAHGYPVHFNISTLGERAALIGAVLPFIEPSASEG